MNSVTELAVAIQHGREDLIPALWESVRGFVVLFANRFFIAYDCSKFSVEADDLIQCGYFALLDALRLYDPDGGANFTTYLLYWLRHSWQDAIGRARRQRMEPLNDCLSLDAPIDEKDDSSVRYDLIPDEHDYIGEADNKIFQEQLHAALEKALAQIDSQDADALRGVYFDCKSLSDLAKDKDISRERIRQRTAHGLRVLRHCKMTKELREYLDDRTPSRMGGTRPTEAAVEYRELLLRFRGIDI